MSIYYFIIYIYILVYINYLRETIELTIEEYKQIMLCPNSIYQLKS